MQLNSVNRVAVFTFVSCLLSLVALIGGLMFMANTQNSQSLVSERKLIESGMAAQGQTLSKLNRDYSWWTDFYVALADKDKDWLVANAAGVVFGTQSVDMAVMFDGNTDPSFAWDTTTGETSDLSIVDANLVQTVKSAVAATPNLELANKLHYMALKGKPALVAYARVVATEAESLKPGDPKPAFAIAYYLTPERVRSIGDAFYVHELSVGSSNAEHIVTLPDQLGVTVGTLSWTPAKPGTDTLFKLVLPLSALALILFAISVYLTLQARRQARELLEGERQARGDADAAHLESLKNAKMAQLGLLTATVAHEIRNPLGSVRTSAFVLKRKFANKQPDAMPLIDRIENGITRCDDIISQLLDYARSREISKQEMALDDWIVKIATEQAEHLPESISLECDLALDQMTVPIDADRLQRVLVNLISNAAEAIGTQNDGTSRAEKITISSYMRGSMVEISVADTGPGIPDDLKDKILQPLFTTKSFGTGLGLSASVNIVEKHGGTLSYENAEGGGAIFRFTLPVAQQQEHAVAQAEELADVA
jgi:signal transduction histidine kinase